MPEANIPTDMVQQFETCQRAPAGKSQMSEQGSSEELMLVLESNSQVNLYVAAKQKYVIVKLRAFFPLDSPLHFLSHLFVCVYGAYLTCQFDEAEQ